MNRDFVKTNRQKLAAGLRDRSVTLLFSGAAPHRSADQFFEFTPNRNFYYLTGIANPQIVLLITKWGEKVEETLFIERPDPVREKWEGKVLDADEAKALSGVQNVSYLDEFDTRLQRLLFADDFQTMYLDLERRQLEAPVSKAQTFAKQLTEKYPYLSLVNIYHDIAQMRRLKSDVEVDSIRKAIAITNQGIQRMMENARGGMTENELEAHFDFALKVAGAKEHAFHSIVAGGQNATVLHYERNDSVIEDGSLVLTDLGAAYGHYSADISRTFPVSGTFSERQKLLYNIVLKAELETIKLIKPGVPFVKLNEMTKQVLTEECKKIGLFENDADLVNYYYHGVSHFLGLDTHDVGSYRDLVLEPGMVLTVEPGLYVSEEGIGIRIEDDVLVTEDGCEVLSKDIIKTVEEIEAFMASKKN